MKAVTVVAIIIVLAVSGLVYYEAQIAPNNPGTLHVFVIYNGGYIPLPVSVSSGDSGTTSTEMDTPLTFYLSNGTYSVSGTYLSVTKSISVAVAANEVNNAILSFSSVLYVGTLNITAISSGNYVVSQVAVMGITPYQTTGLNFIVTTNTDPNNPPSLQLLPGGYSVTGTYDAEPPQNVTVTITVRQVSNVALHFSQ